MRTIPHRELRNNSSAILAEVAEGESFAVTNNGTVAAVLSPAASTPLARARQAGAVREARRHGGLSGLRRASAARPSGEILAELRGGR